MKKIVTLALAASAVFAALGCDTGDVKVEKYSEPAKKDGGSAMQNVQSNPNIPDAAKQGMGLKPGK